MKKSLCFAIVVFVAVLAVFAGSVQAAALKGELGILTPETLAGSNPATGANWVAGDKYRFAFITSETTTAHSADIAVYNDWVQGLANATPVYNIGAVHGATWKVIASTAAVDARDNTSTNGVGGETIFLLDGATVVAINYADLWDGDIQNIINLTETGVELIGWPWTGSALDGTATAPLGNGGQVAQGRSDIITEWIWRINTWDPPATQHSMYALSEPLTVLVDDPTSPTVDAGENMLTWSGQAVKLDPNVVNNDTTPLTFAWSADDASAVFDPSADIEEPNVTIIPPATVTTAISIVNAGFETPAKDDGIYSNDFTDCPGWSAFDGAFGGVWDISAANYGGNAPEGENIAYVYSGTAGIEQVLAETVKADTTYTLSVEVGNNVLPIAPWTGYTVQLLAGGTVLDADDNSLTIAADTIKTSTVVYASGADDVADPNVGLPLQIRLLSLGGGEVNFDDVQLSAVGPAPNPYIVTLTLAVNNEGSARADIKDGLTIDVYDDACQMARIGEGKAADNPGDFDENCITDAVDLDELAANWLAGDVLTGPVPKP